MSHLEGSGRGARPGWRRRNRLHEAPSRLHTLRSPPGAAWEVCVGLWKTFGLWPSFPGATRARERAPKILGRFPPAHAHARRVPSGAIDGPANIYLSWHQGSNTSAMLRGRRCPVRSPSGDQTAASCATPLVLERCVHAARDSSCSSSGAAPLPRGLLPAPRPAASTCPSHARWRGRARRGTRLQRFAFPTLVSTGRPWRASLTPPPAP